MPTLEYRSILDVTDGIICHQINPFTMGAGLARQIRVRYPKHYDDFLEWKSTRNNVWLGHVVFTDHYAPLYIVGLCAQEEYGREPNKCYTRYDALKDCLKQLDYICLKHHRSKLYVPYGIGCGLAGGDWGHVLHYIKEYTPYAIVCKLGKRNPHDKREKIYL